MSTKAKFSIFAATATAISIISYVHVVHNMEREAVKTGVLEDLARQERKKRNLLMMEEQRKLTEALQKAEQSEQS